MTVNLSFMKGSKEKEKKGKFQFLINNKLIIDN